MPTRHVGFALAVCWPWFSHVFPISPTSKVLARCRVAACSCRTKMTKSIEKVGDHGNSDGKSSEWCIEIIEIIEHQFVGHLKTVSVLRLLRVLLHIPSSRSFFKSALCFSKAACAWHRDWNHGFKQIDQIAWNMDTHGYTWIHMVQFHFNCSFLVKCFSDFVARGALWFWIFGGQLSDFFYWFPRVAMPNQVAATAKNPQGDQKHFSCLCGVPKLENSLVLIKGPCVMQSEVSCHAHIIVS